MALFGKRRDTSEAGIERFWTWWNDEGARAAGMGTGDPAVAAQVTDRIQQIDDGLAWEFGAGTESAHLLVVTAGGDPDLRAVARRWLRAAPEGDLVWAYADTRQPVTDPEGHSIQLRDATFDLAQARVAVQRQGTRVDVGFYHPQLEAVPQQQRLAVAFLALDAALGEAATETWIGELSPMTDAPVDGFGLSGLRAVVRDLRAEFTAPDGRPVWLALHGTGPRGTVMARAQVPLAAAWAPHLNQHLSITVPYEDSTDDGLPGAEAMPALRTLQDHIDERLEGQGMVVAHEYSGGVCTVHVYVAGDTPAADQARAAVAGWPQGRAKVSASDDPGWAAVAHLRG